MFYLPEKLFKTSFTVNLAPCRAFSTVATGPAALFRRAKALVTLATHVTGNRNAKANWANDEHTTATLNGTQGPMRGMCIILAVGWYDEDSKFVSTAPYLPVAANANPTRRALQTQSLARSESLATTATTWRVQTDQTTPTQETKGPPRHGAVFMLPPVQTHKHRQCQTRKTATDASDRTTRGPADSN